MTFQEIRIRIKKAQSVDFGDIFSQSIELFKITWTQGLLMFLILIATVFALEMLFIIPVSFFSAGFGVFNEEFFEGLSVFLILLFIVGFLVFMSLIVTGVVGLMGGMYIIYKKADHGESYATSDFFTLLRKDKISKTFKVALAQFGISVIFVLMCYFPIIYVMIPISYFIIIYAYNHELSTREIIKLSLDIGNKFWLQTFLLRIAAGIVAMLGIILCGVGVLATFAFVLIPQYFIYKKTIGFEDKHDIDNIGLNEDSSFE